MNLSLVHTADVRPSQVLYELTPHLVLVLAAIIVKNKKVISDFAVVDEAQDISVPQLRFFAALGVGRPDALFFAGDLGQRIFQPPFSWKALGVDIPGRSRALRLNYRTSHQIRMQADRLLGPVMTDVDGNREDRSDAISVFNGPPPTILKLGSESEEIEAVGHWLAERANAGAPPHEFGVFVGAEAQLERARAAVKEAGWLSRCSMNTSKSPAATSRSAPCTSPKVWNFAPSSMACDDEVIPLQERIETIGDDP